MADTNGAWTYAPAPPFPFHPSSATPLRYCSKSNFVCLCSCSGKYNQSISHWQIPIICNFMGDKHIWNKNDSLNVCMQLPQWANYDYFLLLWNPGDRFLFLKWNWAEKWKKNVSVWESKAGRKKKSGFVTKRVLSEADFFWHTSYSEAQICPNIQCLQLLF